MVVHCKLSKLSKENDPIIQGFEKDGVKDFITTTFTVYLYVNCSLLTYSYDFM